METCRLTSGVGWFQTHKGNPLVLRLLWRQLACRAKLLHKDHACPTSELKKERERRKKKKEKKVRGNICPASVVRIFLLWTSDCVSRNVSLPGDTTKISTIWDNDNVGKWSNKQWESCSFWGEILLIYGTDIQFCFG